MSYIVQEFRLDLLISMRRDDASTIEFISPEIYAKIKTESLNVYRVTSDRTCVF